MEVFTMQVLITHSLLASKFFQSTKVKNAKSEQKLNAIEVFLKTAVQGSVLHLIKRPAAL